MSETNPGDNSLVLPVGERLYHYSRRLDALLKNNRFDPTFSLHEGVFFFTNLPVVYTNCLVEINSNLVLERFSDYERAALGVLRKGSWSVISSLGFDGRVFADPDHYTRRVNGTHALEIMVFPERLYKLGRITTT